MEYLGIVFPVKNRPCLDGDFIPMGAWMQAYLLTARRPFAVAVERADGLVTVRRSFLRDPAWDAANYRYAERLIKFLLWSAGGHRVYVSGGEELHERLRANYIAGGARAFDAGFVQDVYGRPPELVFCDDAALPRAREVPSAMGGHTNGCRIGFDAGGSDRKVAAVMDGAVVYTEEVVWSPKTAQDPDYHLREITAAFHTAASKLPRLDGIGVSTAGVCVENRLMVSSLLLSVPRQRQDEGRNVYVRAADALGGVPLAVANDGDVTALAGAMRLHCGAILGVAMGTSQAAGYVDRRGRVTGRLNELAFAPVDLQEQAPVDDWSGDRGVGAQYFSQEAVVRLAIAAGIALDGGLTAAEQLRAVQSLADAGDGRALAVFRSIGAYLGHTAALYAAFYDMEHLLVLGRVVSGAGGAALADECRRVLREDYPALCETLTIHLPDEQMRRTGQAVAAATLPELR